MKSPLTAEVARKELTGPPCPAAAEHVWELFRDLDAERPAGFDGPSAITSQQMESFGRVRGLRFSALEAQWIRALDDAALASAREKRK